MQPGVPRPETTSMPQKLMEVLSLGRCSHEFSWPRRAPDGHYYQICMLCATEYQYDWTAMRRIGRVEHTTEEIAAASHAAELPRKPAWTPRARRLKLAAPLRYRAKAAAAWIPGTFANLSQSGVLFVGRQSLPPNTLLEMMFEMPEEISGQKKAKVICQGRVIRSTAKKSNSDKDEASELAVSVLDYKFMSRG
jgi:PilZ domain